MQNSCEFIFVVPPKGGSYEPLEPPLPTPLGTIIFFKTLKTHSLVKSPRGTDGQTDGRARPVMRPIRTAA